MSPEAVRDRFEAALQGEPAPTSEGMLERALHYPYPWPDSCYLFHGNEAHPVEDRAVARGERTPVLAYGSNRSPHQLRRKFGALDRSRAILVERCRIVGFDVVHSAHITSYGAIPAALHVNPRVCVVVAVTWLDDEQLSLMDISERAGRNYAREVLPATAILGDDTHRSDVQAYLTSHGPLRIGDEIVGQADIEASGRTHPALGNLDVLHRIHKHMDGTLEFEQFIIRLATDESYRDRVTDRLKMGL